MVARQFLLCHHGEEFPIEYDSDDGIEVLKFQIFSLTSVVPDDQKILEEGSEVEVTEESDLKTISEKLRLVSFHDDIKGKETADSKTSERSDEELARMIQAEEDAIAMQMFQDSGASGRRMFEQRLRPCISQVLMYEDSKRKEAARKSVPIDRIEEKALVSLGKEGNLDPSKEEKDHAFLLQLLYWFKQSFSWVNSPPCENCGSETTFIGMGSPLPSETYFSCSSVELFRCQKHCSKNSTRFPRYNDPLKLLETRRGRCGEWANCFTLYCRAFNYESRFILDFTDHVWTECFSHLHGRWMHLDPCEGVYDNPLLYEKGWNKKLSYVIAISKDGAHDVTKRYTKKWHEILSRRNITTEASVFTIISNLKRECRNEYSHEILSILESRDKKEYDELEIVHLQTESLPSLPGRQSGSKEWRLARSELGSGESDSSCDSSCPVRTCIDSHVHSIHCSLTHLVSSFIGSGLSKSEVAKNLEILRKMLVDVKLSSFKVRKVYVDYNSINSKLFKENSFVDKFLFSLSLKGNLESDEKICITLAGNPVLTSLALPVALHDLDETIGSIRIIDHLDQSLIKNFSRLNRISCGSILASGEQLPFGIATAAFDGCRLSKWEEPNGAQGCWLIYKAKSNQMHILKAYDLMSANDAPERDPMDWILEGGEDGISWNILDQQSFQTFENRFQRRRSRCHLNGNVTYSGLDF